MQIADDPRGVTLPGRDRRGASPGAAPGTPPAAAPRAPRVLVADADPGLRAILRAHLEDAGFAVRTAADGLEALYALHRERPDLVVLDLLLPEVSGFRVLHLLKRDGHGAPPPPVVVLTTLSFDEARDAVRDGADDIATKPVAPAEFVARIARLLQQDGAATLDGQRVPRHAVAA